MKIESAPGVMTQASEKVENKQLRDVSRSFEAMFTNQLVTAMRKTVVKDGFFKESQAEKIYQGMLDSEYSQRMAETEQIGLSKVIYEQLLRAQSGR